MARLRNLSAPMSDHSPILLETEVKDITFHKLENLRDKFDEESIAEFKELNERLASLFLHEEDYCRQRAKQFWLKDGDQNTRFFHTWASARKKTNKINRLKDANGN